jgi:hypothetical protein
MKRSALAFAALAALGMSGCNMDTTNEPYSYRALIESEEQVEGGDTFFTKYDVDAIGNVIYETKSQNGKTLYEIDNYTDGLNEEGYPTKTRTKTITNEDGSRTVQTLTSTYEVAYNGIPLETHFFATQEGIPVWVEERIHKYNFYGNPDEYTLKEFGVEKAHRHKYYYPGVTDGYTYMEYLNGNEEEEVPMFFKAIKRNVNSPYEVLEYELYSNWDNEAVKGIKIEEQTNYKNPTETTAEYNVTKYNLEGEVIYRSVVRNRYKIITFPY